MTQPAELHSYRVFEINFEERLVGAEIIEAEDDLDACRLAKAKPFDCIIEVWDFARFVARIDPRNSTKRMLRWPYKEKRYWEMIERIAVLLLVSALLGYFLVARLVVNHAAGIGPASVDGVSAEPELRGLRLCMSRCVYVPRHSFA